MAQGPPSSPAVHTVLPLGVWQWRVVSQSTNQSCRVSAGLHMKLKRYSLEAASICLQPCTISSVLGMKLMKAVW